MAMSLVSLIHIPAFPSTDTTTADPDLSNPTRPRLERPLDTIRSFEKAIDDGYKRRNSYMKGGKSSPPVKMSMDLRC